MRTLTEDTLYNAFRDQMRTGDLFLVEGRGLFARLIRVLTGQQFSHVALIFRADGGVWVAEMKEGVGFRISPASQWVGMTGGKIYWGRAPMEVLGCGETIVDRILQYRARPPEYSYWALLSVWISQIFGVGVPAGLVCSTLVQRIWARCGVEFSKSADPGDFLGLCRSVQIINTAEV